MSGVVYGECSLGVDVQADVVLLVIGSYSFGLQNFAKVRGFLEVLVNSFDVGPSKIQLSLVQYSRDPHTEFALNTHHDLSAVVKAVRTFPYRGWCSTNTGKAMNYVKDKIFIPLRGARENVPRIMVLITDGKSSDSFKDAATKLRNSDVEIFAVGVKDAVRSELEAIANQPPDNHVFEVEDFDAFQRISKELTQSICLRIEQELLNIKKRRQGTEGSISESYERRIVLVGKTGVGKSAAGNTILGREAFESELSPSSLTSECKKAKGEVDGRRVAVIDTPGLFDTNLSQEEVLRRIKTCVSLSAPGPHAFLVLIQLGRFTQEEIDTVKMIQTTFGEASAKHTMVLFTHGDRLKKQTIEEFVSESKDLSGIVGNCYGRYHVFNNEVKDHGQISRLLDKIDRMAMDNGGMHYTNEMFGIAEDAIEKEKAKLMKEYEAEKQKELKDLRFTLVGMSLHKEEKIVHHRYESKARTQAEKSNDFVKAPVIAAAAVGGATIGFLLGVCGGPIGMLVGTAVGAAVGATAVSVAISVSDKCNVQ